jgi:hypothetical protein
VWEEETQQPSGEIVVVERRIFRSGRRVIGESAPISHQSLSFRMPGTQQLIEWRETASPDLFSVSLNLILVGILGKTAYVVGRPAGCIAYNKWERPKPPLVVLVHEGNEWRRVAVESLPQEFSRPNLIASSPDRTVTDLGTRYVTAAKIREVVNSYRSEEARTISREPIEESDCGELVGNGKGYWTGLAPFMRRENLASCRNHCKSLDFDVQHCPCDKLFKE